MKTHTLLVTVSLLAAAGEPLSASIIYSTSGQTIRKQTFDSLPTTGSANPWTNDSALNGWSLFRQPAPGTAITAIAADNGSGTAGTFVSYGTTGSTERRPGWSGCQNREKLKSLIQELVEVESPRSSKASANPAKGRREAPRTSRFAEVADLGFSLMPGRLWLDGQHQTCERITYCPDDR